MIKARELDCYGWVSGQTIKWSTYASADEAIEAMRVELEINEPRLPEALLKIMECGFQLALITVTIQVNSVMTSVKG